MQELLKPIKTESLKDICVARLEALIFSGTFPSGQKLPSERELALKLGISRPVVHEGLVDLAAKGLVSMKPRIGTVVNDFCKDGSLALLTSLVNYRNGVPDAELLESLLEMRRFFETETARLAALNRTDDHLQAFGRLLAEEQAASGQDSDRLSALDFEFHHLIAMAGGNVIYPLLLNSFKPFYLNLAGRFFADPAVASRVFGYHQDLVHAVQKRDEKQASHIMQRMLSHGERHLKAAVLQHDGSGRD